MCHHAHHDPLCLHSLRTLRQVASRTLAGGAIVRRSLPVTFSYTHMVQRRSTTRSWISASYHAQAAVARVARRRQRQRRRMISRTKWSPPLMMRNESPGHVKRRNCSGIDIRNLHRRALSAQRQLGFRVKTRIRCGLCHSLWSLQRSRH